MSDTVGEKSERMFEKSILVVAHPDDEALWYSSILDHLDTVVICFLDSDDHPMWNVGRRSAIAAHPIANVSTLGLAQPGVFNRADWGNPVISDYGIRLSEGGAISDAYMWNYEKLIEKLGRTLKDYRNVFTHNPWGEYGHEEHVQVYRAISKLQQDMPFNLWYSNYCSNKSYKLMLGCASRVNLPYVTLKTDEVLGKRLKALYGQNDCWTWYDDYEWFKEESFLLDSRDGAPGSGGGRLFPINFLIVGLVGGASVKKGRVARLVKVVTKLGRRLYRRIIGCLYVKT